MDYRSQMNILNIEDGPCQLTSAQKIQISPKLSWYILMPPRPVLVQSSPKSLMGKSEHPTVYVSRKLTMAEQQYVGIEQEALTIR